MTLAEHIKSLGITPYAYAKSIAVTPDAVNKMIKKGYLWHKGRILKVMRDTNKAKGE